MGTQANEARRSPPYMPIASYKNFVRSLSETVLPPRIDASVMSKFPGSVKAQLRSGLTYIGAIDEQGAVQPSFKRLVAAWGTDKWQAEFKSQFLGWYKSIIGDLDLTTATLSQLKDRFKDAGVEGSVIIKATRFFLAGLDEAGINYSPHFKVRGALSGGTAPSRPKKPKAARPARRTDEDFDYEGAGESLIVPQVPEGYAKLSLPLPGRTDAATLVLPTDTNAGEWRMIAAYVLAYFNIKA